MNGFARPCFMLFALATTQALMGCAQSEMGEEDVGTSESSIIRGTDLNDLKARTSGIVLLKIALSSTHERICSGIMVAPNWVLTASHCFEPADDANSDGEIDAASLSKVVVRHGNASDTSAQTRVAQRIVRHPSSIWGNQPGGTIDAALVRVTAFDVSQVPRGHFAAGVNGAKRLPLLAPMMFNGSRVTPFGYGANTGQVVGGAVVNTTGFGTLRTSTLTVSAPDDLGFWVRSQAGTGNLCGGDSGGPTVVDDIGIDSSGYTFELRTRFLAGVNNAGWCDTAPYDSFVLGTGAIRDWLVSTVGSYGPDVALACDGANCSTTPSPLPHSANWVGAYAPRGYNQNNCYYVTASYSFEVGYDYVTLAGTKLTGSGTYRTHYCGTFPAIATTDGSVDSSGVTFSASNYFQAPATNNSCSGSTGGWNACRGNGCAVCVSHTTEYPKYFQNHPLCAPNLNCGGTNISTCSSNCPAPTDADR